MNVLRLGKGDPAVLFNGHGRHLTVEVTEANRREVRFKTIGEAEAPPRQTWITLAQSIPKGKNMDLIVQKAVELGAAEIIPIISERTVVSLDGAKAAEKKQAKWQQIAIEACKQCGQSWLTEVREPQRLDEFLGNRPPSPRLRHGSSSEAGEEAGKRKSAADTAAATEKATEFRSPTADLRLVASLQEDSLHLKEVLREYEAKHDARPMRVTILIGPEGDLTEAEYVAARAAGFQAITLGSIILRVETAAIYCLSVLSYELAAVNS